MIPNTNPDTCAFTSPADTDQEPPFTQPTPGLTKFEWFAGLALHGILVGTPSEKMQAHDSISSDAVLLAEALIHALNNRVERINKTILERNRDDTDGWDEQRKLLLIAEKSWRTRMDAGEDPTSSEMQQLRKQWEKLYR